MDARNKYEILARDYRLINRHLMRIKDARYTPLTDNGFALLEAESTRLWNAMKELEPLL